ncbi:hypothetical protein JR065_09825 [Xanthomonas sp. AmX2]|uniref:hypothetical protein n=1 Tax=Xanthomonas sp. TaxID=29446 RepID=UPI00197CF379|nr:hypothetical protein [Xanthomonas sp.]MBN6150638.1 hypothetical protein [Xanthomonas sp.]
MKTASFALTFAIAAAFAAPSFAANAVTTLETVQVRPSADQLAQRDAELASGIPTLASVQVRPSAEQIAQLNAETAMGQRVVTLAAVQVRPSAAQAAEAQAAFVIGTAVSGALNNAMLQLQPSLQGLGQNLATQLVR